jgi:hypothetical protein
MNVFSGIAHFFKSLFGPNSTAVQKLLHSISGFVGLAEPIILEVENDLKEVIKAGDKTLALPKIVEFLSRYEPDVAKAGDIANSLSGLPVSDLLHNLAVIALSTVVPAGTATSLVRMAVELAYNIFKSKKAAAALATA